MVVAHTPEPLCTACQERERYVTPRGHRRSLCAVCFGRRMRGETSPERCECGKGKRLGDECCSRCEAMDGNAGTGRSKFSERDMVTAMRGLGHVATSSALRLELGVEGKSEERQFWRVIAGLEKQGRIRRLQYDETMLDMARGRDVRRNKDGSPVVPGSSMALHGPSKCKQAGGGYPVTLVLTERRRND